MKSNQPEDLVKFSEKIHSLRPDFFSPSEKIFVNRCPGRLDLMGGNDDYSGGMVFETTIKETTMFAAQKREDSLFILKNPSVQSMGWNDTITFSLSDISTEGQLKPLQKIREFVNKDEKKSWFTYIVGGLCYLLRNYPNSILHGLNMYLDSNIPLGKGVSSSAALETSALKACAAVYGINITGIDLALATQWVECAVSGSAAGIMDQYAVVMGDVDTFTPMLCQPCLSFPKVKLPEGIKIWGIDSGVRHSVSGNAYESARAAAFMGYQYLCDWEKLPVKKVKQGPLDRYTDPRWEGYLARITPTEFRTQYEERLPDSISGKKFLSTYAIHFDPYTHIDPDLTYNVRLCTRYAIEENNRVNLFYEIIRGLPSDPDSHCLQILGELMAGAHHGYTDCGLGCKETDLLVDMVKAEKKNGLFGAKITGGGAGGTVAVLGKNNPAASKAVQKIFEEYQEKTGRSAWLFEGSSKGADAFGILTID